MFFRDQYSETLTQQWVEIFKSIFAVDNYTPIYIENAADFVSVMAQFPFYDETLQQVT